MAETKYIVTGDTRIDRNLDVRGSTTFGGKKVPGGIYDFVDESALHNTNNMYYNRGDKVDIIQAPSAIENPDGHVLRYNHIQGRPEWQPLTNAMSDFGESASLSLGEPSPAILFKPNEETALRRWTDASVMHDVPVECNHLLGLRIKTDGLICASKRGLYHIHVKITSMPSSSFRNVAGERRLCLYLNSFPGDEVGTALKCVESVVQATPDIDLPTSVTLTANIRLESGQAFGVTYKQTGDTDVTADVDDSVSDLSVFCHLAIPDDEEFIPLP